MVIDNTDHVVSHVTRVFEGLNAAQAHQTAAIRELDELAERVPR